MAKPGRPRKDAPPKIPEFAPGENVYNSQYTLVDRRAAVAAYLSTGNVRAAAKLCGIPVATVGCWKKKADWWPELVKEVSLQLSVKLDAKLQIMVDKTTNIIIDRLENGDIFVDRNGTPHRVPMSASKASGILSSAFEKQRLIHNLPTKMVSTNEALNKIADKFREFAEKKLSGEVIEAEQVRDNHIEDAEEIDEA